MEGDRFQAISERIPEGSVIADIACDHAVLPVALLKEGRIRRAIAGDLNPQPLARGRARAAQHGFADAIDFRLGDGLSVLRPGEADTIVIAGVGGVLLVKMLEAAPEVVASAERLLLLPHRSPALVREWVSRQGHHLADEVVVEEEGYYYELFTVTPEASAPLVEVDLVFGPFLRHRRDSVSEAYFARRRASDERLLAHWRRALPERPDLDVRIRHLEGLWAAFEEDRK